MANCTSPLPPIGPAVSSPDADRDCPAGLNVQRARPGLSFSTLNLPAVGSDQARQRLSASTVRRFVSHGRAFRQVGDRAAVFVRSVTLAEGC